MGSDVFQPLQRRPREVALAALAVVVATAGASVPTIRPSRAGVSPWLKMITAEAPAACALIAFVAKGQKPR